MLQWGTLTVSPRRLSFRGDFDEPPAWTLEEEIALESGKALELRGDGVQVAGIERGTLR